MAGTGKRASKRDLMIRKVLAAARDILSREGAEALTIQRLAKVVGASVGGLYRYFDSKSAIIFALEREAVVALIETQRLELLRAEQRFAAEAPPPEVALCCALVGATSFMRTQVTRQVEHRLLLAIMVAPDKLLTDDDAQAIDQMLAPVIAAVSSRLKEAADAGAIDAGDAVRRTYQLWATTLGIEVLAKRDRLVPPRMRSTSLLDELLETMLVGWGTNRTMAQRTLARLAEFESSGAVVLGALDTGSVGSLAPSGLRVSDPSAPGRRASIAR